MMRLQQERQKSEEEARAAKLAGDDALRQKQEQRAAEMAEQQ